MLRRRKFWQIVATSLISNTVFQKLRQVENSNLLKSSNANLANSIISSGIKPINVEIIVDWSTVMAKTNPLIFGSNDYEITSPQKATDSIFQSLLTELDIPLIRVHHSQLSERWTNSITKSWDEAKIKTCYDASYPHNPKIVQNIPQWPSWMKQNKGLLDPSEYDNYANFCGELVRILNKTQNRNIIYWEPFNELDKRYKNAGKLNELWQIYNKVTERMKKVDSQIKVGGPVLTWNDYQTLNHFLDSCSQNVGFISWHRYATGNASAPTDKIMSFTPKYGEQTRKFRSIVTKHIPKQKVPLFLSEYNINYSWDSGETRQNTHIGAVWFASVFKHLAEAEIDMAASWHLKDGIYGMINPQNKLRPSAKVFNLATKYLNGNVVKNESDHPFIEALPIQQKSGKRSLLLINKTSEYVNINLTEMYGSFQTGETKIHSLNADGIEDFSPNEQTDINTFTLSPYSILLLRSLKPFSYSD